MGLAHGRWELHDDQRVLSQYLGDAGYETHLFGLQHLTTNVDRLAYDEIHHPDVRTPQAPPVVHQRAKARRIAPDVAAWLRDRESEEPFFASVGFFELHRVERDDGTFGFGGEEYEHPEATDVEAPAFLPDRPGIRRDVAEMHGMVHAVDDGVGTILDGLAEAGLDAETLVVFTTEHGLAFPRAKGCCYDSGIGAALLCRHPSIVESESVRTELCSNVDVFATLLDLADVEIPADVFGHSLRPLLSGDGDAFERRERIFAGMT